MTRPNFSSSIIAAISFFLGFAGFQASGLASPDRVDSLVLAATIPLSNVSGRIDHISLDRKRQRLIVAALGNNTVEVIDIVGGRRSQRITGLAQPQGVAYSEKADLLFVANAADGSVRMFQGPDLAPAGRIDLHDDADNIRIDPQSGNVIVGYGNGGLAIIDPERRTLSGTISLPGHPEGFQVDVATGRVFVNVPDAGQIAVVDLSRRQQTAAWKVPGASANFPMAIDSGNGVLAVVFRDPARLVLLDTKTGNATLNVPTCGDADDVFFDTKRGRIYISCGAGEIAVFQSDGHTYLPLNAVATASGARTSLFLDEPDRLFVAERAALSGSTAAICVYQPIP